MTLYTQTRMNPGGRFAPQSQLSETAKDGALLRGFGGAALDLGRGPASLQITVVKDVQKKGTHKQTDRILAESPKIVTPPNLTDPARWVLLPQIFWFWNF